MADDIGKAIAAAHKPNEAPDARSVAEVLVKNLFDTGPNRLPASARYVAITALTAGLESWRQQLAAANQLGAEYWQKAYRDAKAEMEELKTRLFFMERDK